PRIVVIDCALPGMSGLTATQKILERWPDVAVVMLTVHNEPHVVQQALEAGVRGFVTKSATEFSLAEIVKRVASGESVIDPRVVSAPSDRRVRGHQLSPRQVEVLQLICQGLSNHAIAAKLGLSVNTIDVHRARIMKTLGVHRSAELVVYAIRHGLVDAP
ncbi:MAG TPA: response regulator transcription factor, partial [Vicinamibacterales bacterium]|nr:response regulator transcription factor [Vicinamibacterales bacterium]